MPVDLLGTEPLGAGVSQKPGVVLTPALRDFLARVRRRLTFDIVVSSGVRTPEAQARAWRGKLDAGATRQELLDLYRRDDLVLEVLDRSDLSVGSMAVVLRDQVARGDLLSSHLSGRALDLRVHGYTEGELASLVQALKLEGGRVVVEDKPPHIHVEVLGGTDRRDQAQPYVEPLGRPDVTLP